MKHETPAVSTDIADQHEHVTGVTAPVVISIKLPKLDIDTSTYPLLRTDIPPDGAAHPRPQNPNAIPRPIVCSFSHTYPQASLTGSICSVKKESIHAYYAIALSPMSFIISYSNTPVAGIFISKP